MAAAGLNALADAITNTLSPDAAQRRAAENFLSQQATSSPDLPFILLQFIANENAPTHVRQATAVYLKNATIKAYSNEDTPLPLNAYVRVKSSIVEMMLNVPAPIRRQLGEVLATIAEHEYPVHWPQLVPSLTEKLASIIHASSLAAATPGTSCITAVNWSSMFAVLETLQAIFDRYPERMRSDVLFTEIKYSLQHSQEHVLALFSLVTKAVNDDLNTLEPTALDLILKCIDVLCHVFHALSWQDLPEYFEDHLQEYMSEIRKLLVFSSERIDGLYDDEKSPLDDIHAAVLEIANLYAIKYDEEFRPFLQQFMSDAWALLMRRGNAPRFDVVVTTGIKFLSSVARSPDYQLFKDPTALSGVCNRIVIPNIEIRDEDVEMFEDDPREYVRHDLEGSDTGTRRRGAVELVKGLCVHYEKEVTEIFSSYLQSIFLPETDWRKRDTAIYLVIALGWKSGTLMRGVTEMSSLMDIPAFFKTFVVVQLHEAGNNAATLASPIFTADLIKFVIAFRHQLPVDGCKQVAVFCGQLLGAKEVVVRTYASACFERLLTMREGEGAGHGAGVKNGGIRKVGAHRLVKADIEILLPSLLPAVAAALKATARPDEYLMRFVLRLSTFCREGMGPHVDILLATLVELLVAAMANPGNPMFNHYLFECIAALIRFNANSATIGIFENRLMPTLCNILITDITEFGPYVFQVWSQMLLVHKEGAVPDQYRQLMNPTLNPAMWERRAYVAGMVLYIESYLRRAKEQLMADEQMEATLGVFQKLIASTATDHHGLHLLSTIFETFEIAVLSPFVRAIFSALMLRLSRAKTAKFVNHLLCLLSTFVLRFGVKAMRDSFDSVERNVLAMLLTQVWLPDVVKIRNVAQRRLCSIGLSEVSSGSDLCVEDPYLQLWPEMVTANVAMVEGIVVEDDEGGDGDGDFDEEVAIGDVHLGAAETYSSTQSILKWGLAGQSAKSSSCLIEGKDAKFVLFQKVSSFMERQKPRFDSVFKQKVDPQAQQAFEMYAAQVRS